MKTYATLKILFLAGLSNASVFYLLNNDYANANAGVAEVYDYLAVWDDDGQAFCNNNSGEAALCTTESVNDGTSCSASYKGDNAAWAAGGIVGNFVAHDKGTFHLTAGTIVADGLGTVDVTTDTRCEPYTCTGAGFGFTAAAGGFRCVFDY